MSKKQNITRNNHYVPQMYLNAWKNEEDKVFVYDLLVPNSNTPLWKSKSIRSIASENNFYVSFSNNEETDRLEKWFDKNYETPAASSLKKSIAGDYLSESEQNLIIKYIACQIVRTPAFFIKILNNKNIDFENTFFKTMEEVATDSKFMSVEDFKKQTLQKTSKLSDELLPLEITDMNETNSDGDRLIKIGTIKGKQFYFFSIVRLLETTADILFQHKWIITDIDNRVKLPTSDNPVVCLNYHPDNTYDFEGGWGNKYSGILFPISPNKIFWTQIGNDNIYLPKADIGFSVFLKKIIVQNSYRKVFSSTEDDIVTCIKSRCVNLNKFREEKEFWLYVHENYLEKETAYISRELKYKNKKI